MKRTNIATLLIGTLIMFSPSPANAQFNKILKSVGKAIGMDNETNSKNTDAAEDEGNGNATAQQDESPTLTNPIPDIADIELVGVYGKDTSEDKGDVSVVLKIKLLKSVKELYMGCNLNFPSMLVDEEGNSFEAPIGWYLYSAPEGVSVKVPVNKTVFKDIPKAITTIQHLQFGISVDGTRGLLILKNVPLRWEGEE